MSNYNDNQQRKISREILRLNQQYINHLKNIEEGRGLSGGGFSGGRGGSCEYVKKGGCSLATGYAGGARMTTKQKTNPEPIEEGNWLSNMFGKKTTPKPKTETEFVPYQYPTPLHKPDVQEFILPEYEHDEPTPTPAKEEKGWFDTAKDWVSSFFGGKRPTKKQRLEIEAIFRSKGHDIGNSNNKTKGGFKLGDLGNMDFWNSINISGGQKPKLKGSSWSSNSGNSWDVDVFNGVKKPKLKGGFKLGRLVDGDFWSNLDISSGNNKSKDGFKVGDLADADWWSNLNISEGGKKSCKGKGMTARSMLVRKIMKEKHLNLPQASAYIKQNNLY